MAIIPFARTVKKNERDMHCYCCIICRTVGHGLISCSEGKFISKITSWINLYITSWSGIASFSGCKHEVALLAWWNRRSEEKTVNKVACFWKKNIVLKVGSTVKYLEASSMRHTSVKERKMPYEYWIKKNSTLFQRSCRGYSCEVESKRHGIGCPTYIPTYIMQSRTWLVRSTWYWRSISKVPEMFSQDLAAIC